MWNLFQAIRRSWLKHFVTQITAIFILAITYTASLFIVLSMLNIKNIFYVWGKVNEVTVYLENSPKDKDVDKVIASIRSHDFVDKVQFISSSQSADQFKKRFSKHSPQAIKSDKIKDFFPSSLQVQLESPISSEADILGLKNFADLLKRQFKVVEEVVYGQSWMTKFVRLLQGFEAVSWLLVGIIFLASLFVSMNVFKTVIHSRKEEIEILQFIGATSFWIYGPPVVNCCVLSAIGFSLAVLCNYGIYTILGESLAGMFSSYLMEQAQFFSPLFLIVFFILLISSVFFTSLAGASQLSIRRGKS